MHENNSCHLRDQHIQSSFSEFHVLLNWTFLRDLPLNCGKGEESERWKTHARFPVLELSGQVSRVARKLSRPKLFAIQLATAVSEHSMHEC